MQLDFVSLRILGALIEKEITTPDAYPLSVNSLISGANQRSSRDPVTDYTEEDVSSALDTLIAHELVVQARDASRVARFEHRVRTVFHLRRDETAVLCLLLLRGAQTPGELRSRSDRLFQFEDPASVQATLDRLASREEPLVRALPRMPGSREIRSIHLLGAPLTDSPAAEVSRSERANLQQRLRDLEQRVKTLEERLQSETC